MAANDRGRYVRTRERYVELTGAAFDRIDGEILSNVTRIPSSHWLMRMPQPGWPRPEPARPGDQPGATRRHGPFGQW